MSHAQSPSPANRATEDPRSAEANLAESTCGRLPPLVERALPKCGPMLAMLGPGVVWMALAQGSGELIWWPWAVSKYGLSLMFLLIPACLLQYPLNYQIGRYTLLTGESVLQGLIRRNRWLALLLYVMMTISFFWLGAFVKVRG